MRIVVLGAGGVGGLLGAFLARAGEPVTFIARGDHLKAIQTRGLEIRSFRGDFSVQVPAADSPAAIDSPVDCVLFCVKSYQTGEGIKAITPLMTRHADAVVLCLQNGVSNERLLADAFGPERVLSGVVYVGAEIAAPGVIQHDARGEVVLGEWGTGQRRVVDAIARMFDKSGIPTTVVPDIKAAKWQKFLFNCALNAMTSITGSRLGALMENPISRHVFQGAVAEAAAVARAEGIQLPADAVEQVMTTAGRMDIRSSMQADLERGRPLELDAFNGYVVELGRKHGIPTPINATLYGLLRVIVEGLASRSAPGVEASPSTGGSGATDS